MRWILILLLFMAGCTDGVSLKTVNYDSLLNDDNSKVWIINKQIVNNVNIANGHNWNKELMIFYNNGKVEILPMKALGRARPKLGHYYLDSQENLLEISFSDEEWIMNLSYVTEDSIYLSSDKKSDVQIDLQIIPFQQLN